MKNEKDLPRRNRRSFLAAGAAIEGTLAATGAKAQALASAQHKVVFELNAPVPSGWDQIGHNVDNLGQIFAADGVQVEMVCFGRGLAMLLKKNTEFAERLKTASDKGVTLAACQNSMWAMRVTTEDLFPFAAQVGSGVAELVRKQEAGPISRAGSDLPRTN
ncbi:MAG: DsrE family protein [Acidobacteriia bacterium]|nr:DsrE family protein [Terriglobia bacterium]